MKLNLHMNLNLKLTARVGSDNELDTALETEPETAYRHELTFYRSNLWFLLGVEECDIHPQVELSKSST